MDHILNFWDAQAVKHKTKHSASWADIYMLQIERLFLIDAIKSCPPGSSILDAGTSNGHSLVEIAKQFPQHNFEGFDFAPNMVANCNELIKSEQLSNVSPAYQADIRDLTALTTTKFDFVFTTRVLINLPTWEEQKIGIDQMLSHVSPGGRLVIMEGFWEPLIKLNSLRTIAGLEPLREHDFNRYIKQSNLEAYLSKLPVNYENFDFSSTYYLMTRFIREAIGADKKDIAYNSDFNHSAMLLSRDYAHYNNAGFGIQQSYIITKN